MNITKIEIDRNVEGKNLIGIVNIIINNQFKLEDIKLMKGNKGMYLLFPQNSFYKCIYYPTKEEIRQKILEKILKQYNKDLTYEKLRAS